MVTIFLIVGYNWPAHDPYVTEMHNWSTVIAWILEQVKSYPRRAYNINDSSATLNEVGLSNKNEALFLELI
jgi:hypothetical protein